MKIAVCIKRVPSTEARIKVAADGRSADPTGLEYVVSPYDEYGIEEALSLRDAKGGGEVVVVSVGPKEAETQIRTALAMGADRGILVKTDAALDPFSTGQAIAAALKDEKPDLVFFGIKAVDDDAAQVPAYACHALGIPLVSVVVKLEVGDGKLTARRQIEGGTEVMECPLPAGITAQKGLNTPRFASLPNIMKAKKKPIAELAAPAAAPKTETAKLELPPPRAPGKIVGTGVEAVPELVRLLREEAKVI